MIRLLTRAGLYLGAIHLEVDKLDAIPEFQRGWYVQDQATGKFKLDPAKVDVEDVAGLRNAVAATRREAAEAKAEAERKIREALAPYDGIDPKKVKDMMSHFASEDERKAIEGGRIDEVISKRMEKARTEYERKVQEAAEREEGALEVATSYMEQVLDNQVQSVAIKAGVLPSAMEDALLRARMIFSLDENGKARQFEDDGETAVLNAKGEPFTVNDWIEERRKDCPHWFANGNTGGSATGSLGRPAGPNMAGMSPTQRLTAARQAQGKK